MRGRGGRGRGGIRRAPGRTSKTHTELKPWTEDDQKDMLFNKLLEFMRPSKLSSSLKKDAVELYYITDLIPFVISRIGKLATKPASRDQLHATIKKSLQDDPYSANAPPVDVVYIFCKLLAEGLISISIKQEVCFYNPPLPQYTNPRDIQVVERPKAAPYEADQDLTWSIHQSWYERQKSWRGIQQNYLTKNTDRIDKSPQYQTLQSHYERVCKWIQNITQKQLDQYKESIGENNNNSSRAFGVEFHTHNTPWKFLETVIKLFRVSRKIDDKLVDEIIQALEENGRLKIENNQVTYLNKVVPTGPSVPPIAPAITSIFAPTPSHFYQYNRIQVKDETQNVSQLLPILEKIGNPDTTFYIFSHQEAPVKAETPKEQPAVVEAKKVEAQQQTKSWATPTVPSPAAEPPKPAESKPVITPSTPPEQPAPSSAPQPVQAAKPSWASISSKAASLPQAQPQPPKPQPQTKQPTQQPTKKSQQPAKKSSNPPNKKKY